MSRCLITGAVLDDRAHERAIRCDLFRIGEVWIAHLASINGRHPAWEYNVPVPESSKVLEINSHCPTAGFYEHGLTFAVHSDWAKLNDTAKDYLGGAYS